MKKQFLLMLLMMLPMFANAHDIVVQNGDGVKIYYNYTNNGTELEVTRHGTSSGSYWGNVIIPEEVTYNNKTYKVTSIDQQAFKSCTTLSSITIPNSVTSIGDLAFYECSGLTSVTIPNRLTSIGNEAFSACYGLTSITIPNSVTSIGEYAFSGCYGLISMKVESENTTYDSRDNCNAIIETASKSLVAGCKNTIIPNSVTSIGNRAFEACYGLTSITIPNSVTSIGSGAFNHCDGLTSVTIPNSVTSIGSGAFYGCYDLTSVTIPNSVTSIGRDAFLECSRIVSVNISCEIIDNTWFGRIPLLEEIILGDGVKVVKENAFKGCNNLKTIDIGSTITSIEARAFSGTDKLTDVTCRATVVPETDKTAFENSYPNYAVLHVPTVSQTAYKETAPWSEFKEIVSIIQDLPDDAEQCATPTISYQNGKLSFACITEGVEFQYQITDNDIKIGVGTEVSLDATYHISVYTTKNGYKDSEIAIATLCWIDQKPATEGITDGVANVPANAVLIQSVGGMLSVSGVPVGITINVYDLSGRMTGSAKASSETTNIATTLRSGEVGIVKIGEKSVKYVVK